VPLSGQRSSFPTDKEYYDAQVNSGSGRCHGATVPGLVPGWFGASQALTFVEV